MEAPALDVGAAVDQCVEDVHVVTTRRPVQGRFRKFPGGWCIGIRTRGNQRGDHRRPVGEVTGPVSHHVQRGAPVDSRRRESGIRVEKA